MFYLAHSGYHALPHTKHATNSTTKGTPYRVPSGQDPWVWPDNPAYPPWPHLRYPLTSKDEDPNNKKLLGRVAHERRGQYCFISLTQDIMHYLTQNMPQTLRQKAPLTGCLLGKIHGFCPPNRTYPPQPHLQKLHTEGQRKILFYLPYNNNTIPINFSERDSNDSKTTR